MWVIRLTWVWTGLVPQTTTRSECSAISVAGTPQRLPWPALKPVSESMTQIVLLKREYFLTWVSRSMPSRCTRPMVPAYQ